LGGGGDHRTKKGLPEKLIILSVLREMCKEKKGGGGCYDGKDGGSLRIGRTAKERILKVKTLEGGGNGESLGLGRMKPRD